MRAFVWMLLLCACLPALAVIDAPPPLHILTADRPVVIDGKLDEWTLTAPVSYEVDASSFDQTARTYAMWDAQHLYLAYVVRDASPLKNAGDDPSAAFKTGDSLHFYLNAGGETATTREEGGPQDFHVIMTMQREKPVVFAYRQRKAGVDKPTLITSPATRIEMAWMGPVPGAQLAVTRQGNSYTAEVQLPLAFFDDFHPQAKTQYAADVAVNFSNTAGTSNMAKVWWSRGASQILDIPTELRFERHRWGTAVFCTPEMRPLVTDNANFYLVPPHGAVTVDGDLADWDLSCAYGPAYVDPQLKDRYNVTWAAMYDAQALYLGAVFHSAQPFTNNGGVDNVWWIGDSLEFRLIADPKNQGGDIKKNNGILTFGVWHNAAENKDYVALQRSFDFLTGDASNVSVRSKEVPGGRAFELRVPWTLVQSGSVPKAGDSIAWTMAAIWNNGLRAYGMGSISSFRGINDWGQAHFLPQGKQELVYLNLHKPEAAEAAPVVKAETKVTVPEKGLLSAGVYSVDGRLLRTLAVGKSVTPGALTLGWDGMTDDNTPVTPGAYQVRTVLNAGLHARYVASVGNPGSPPYQSENPLYGWGGVWDNVKDIAADAHGVYPLWGMEEGDGALLQMNEDGKLQWRQHIPLALNGTQTAVATNGTYVFVGVNCAGAQEGKAGLWRVRCADGSYAPFAHTGSDPLGFYLEGVTRPVKADMPPVTSLAADAKYLYVSAYHQNQVAVFDAETGKPVRSYAVEQPMGLCLDGPDALLVISGTRVLRLSLADGTLTPVITKSLLAPFDVAVAADGSILVTDRGTAQQVKRFDRRGAQRGRFGKAGGRDNNGKFAVDHLLNPAGITVSASGKVFYTEDASPKLIVRLSKSLKYEQLFAGPWYLSGEVCVDPEHPEHVYLYTHQNFVRFVIDYRTGASRPDAVWSDFALPHETYARWFPRIVHHEGKTYLFCGGTNSTLFRIDGDRMLLIAAVGIDRAKKDAPMWSFTDENENGHVDAGEMRNYPPFADLLKNYYGTYWAGSIEASDLTMYLMSGGQSVLAITPTFARPGVPRFAFDTSRVIPLTAAHKPGKEVGLSNIWQAPDGGIFGNADANGSDPRGIGHSSHLSDVYVYRVDRDGKLLWRAGKKASGIAKNGEFYGRACGLGGPIGTDFFSFVDENGQDKVFTVDGLFVGNLLEDTATAVPHENTLFVEHFNSVVYQNAVDGKWYFTAGAGGYASIWEIAGMDKVTRLTSEITLK